LKVEFYFVFIVLKKAGDWENEAEQQAAYDKEWKLKSTNLVKYRSDNRAHQHADACERLGQADQVAHVCFVVEADDAASTAVQASVAKSFDHPAEEAQYGVSNRVLNQREKAKAKHRD
jgi:hypothetical protein